MKATILPRHDPRRSHSSTASIQLLEFSSLITFTPGIKLFMISTTELGLSFCPPIRLIVWNARRSPPERCPPQVRSLQLQLYHQLYVVMKQIYNTPSAQILQSKLVIIQQNTSHQFASVRTDLHPACKLSCVPSLLLDVVLVFLQACKSSSFHNFNRLSYSTS